MAGNSVPVFFGAKARTKRPPGLDVTFTTDLSGSMGPYAAFVSAQPTIIALENELVAQGVGVISTNRYSFTTGGGRRPNFSTLPQIELPVKVDNISQRWATGAEVLANRVTLPSLVANKVQDTEDMGLSTNIIANNDRQYLPSNQLIIVSSSDEQQGLTVTAFDTTPVYSYRYVGIHSVDITITEPAGPNAIPAGTLTGFVYTTNTTGTAIYVSGTTINYRTDVPVANVTATATTNRPGGAATVQSLVDQTKDTNGAIYDIRLFQGSTANLQFPTLATSLGNVLGRFLFETS